MDILKGIEGDFIETRNDNLIFDVKGLLHPNDRKICFLRFYPDRKGDRIRNGKKYKKIYDLKERYSFLREKFPQYLFFSEELDIEVQGVRNKDIKTIYSPREFFKNLYQNDELTKVKFYSKELCELFIDEGLVPSYSIGISGSEMVGLSKEDSDIDIVIYGTKIGLDFQTQLEQILEESKDCRAYTLEEFSKHYDWRAGGSNVPFEDFLKSEKRKLHQGKYRGIDFFIRYIKSPEDWGTSYYDYMYKDCGRIKIEANIIDSTDSIFTPCTYKIKVNKMLGNSVNPKDIRSENIREINSFRGRFCEHAQKGERVLVEGKLERVSFKGKEEYFRILLGDQALDKMILLSE